MPAPLSKAPPGYDEALAARRRDTRELRHRADSREWMQADCAFSGPGAPWRELAAFVGMARAEGRISRTFFVRHPWGIRLRQSPVDRSGDVEVDLAAWLAAAEQDGRIDSWRFGIYQPETDRFGGRSGMALAHGHFDADSRAVLAYETLSVGAQKAIPRTLFSLTIINDLFAHSVVDRAQLRKVWRDIRRALCHDLPQTSRPGAAMHDQTALDAITADSKWLATLPADAQRVVAAARKENRMLGDSVRAGFATGRLDAGLSGWLADVAAFHWNRIGLPAVAVRPIVDAAVAIIG